MALNDVQAEQLLEWIVEINSKISSSSTSLTTLETSSQDTADNTADIASDTEVIKNNTTSILADTATIDTNVGTINTNIASLLAKFTGAHTLTSNLVTTDGTVSSGAYSVSFTPEEGFTGTVNGQTLLETSSISITASTGKTLPAIAYTVSAGNLRIDILI